MTQPSVGASPIGSRLGIDFFATMHRAYLHTPGVQLTVVSRGSKRAVFGHFLLRLQAGTVVGEEFAGSGGDQNRLVARRNGPTYGWKAKQGCWQSVPPADPRTLTGVGLPYPYSRAGSKTRAPRRHGAELILETENPDGVWFLATQNVYGRSAKRFVTYTVSARTDRIRAITIRAAKGGTRNIHPHGGATIHWWTAGVRVTTLTSAPRLPKPVPACK